MQNIGNLIRAVRVKNNLTQEEFAKKFFLDKKTIGNYENNRRMPDIVFLNKLCNEFDLSMDYFRAKYNEDIEENQNLIVVYDEDLKKLDFKGNYLFNKFDEVKKSTQYYFLNHLSNALFIKPKKECEERSDLYLDIEQYLLNFFDVCAKIKTKPSFMLLNCWVDLTETKNKLGDKYFDILSLDEIDALNEKTSFYMSFGVEEDYNSLIKYIIEKRSFEVPKNDLIIFIDNLEETNIKDIALFMTLARSRRIYFVLMVKDIKLNFWEQCNHPNARLFVEDDSEIKYICNLDKIESVKIEDKSAPLCIKFD